MTDLQEYYRAEERLRQTVECINNSSLEAIRSLEILEKENARLRELVRDMWHEGAFQPGACYVYEADRLEERTRELGIEVD